MDIRTENLTILFVDIAGFTATTSRQSRLENANLLQTFEKTLLPLIRRFKGNVVKSIGDALLLTFRSPTDAMLCSMALQDAMHAHNLRASDDEKIHIRVAANLGEVRVTKKDIFGEPVNVASRIEGVTPADEIYLSEAVYMAMNKAEVPALEVGFRELAGIPQAVRLYSIPRFATHRLVPQNQLPPDQGNELLFPYGGMHQRLPSPGAGFRMASDKANSRYALAALALVCIGAGAVVGIRWFSSPPTSPPVAKAVGTPTIPSPAPDQGESPVIEIPRHASEAANKDQGTAAENPAKLTEVAAKSGEKADIAPPKETRPAPASAKPAVVSTSKSTINQPAVTEPAASRPTPKPVTSPPPPTAAGEKVAAPSPSPVAAPVWSVTSAKAAYRAGQIDKAEYRRITNQLEVEYDAKIRALKLAYRAKQISETEYEEKVREAKRAYSGR